jgi:hypothetical protein
MRKAVFPDCLRQVFLAVIVLLGATAASAETPVGSVVETRVLIGVEADPDALNALMPVGWDPIPFPSGPLKGANAMFGFLDAHVVLDTDDTPTGNRLTAAVMALGKQSEGKNVRLFVLRVFTDDPEANPYGNTHVATLSRSRTLTTSSSKERVWDERWTVTPDSGGEIALALTYKMGTPRWSTGTSKSFSAENTDTVVTQTYQQIADVALSSAMNKPLSGSVSLNVTAADLPASFDGAQTIGAVITIPVYIRQVYLP